MLSELHLPGNLSFDGALTQADLATMEANVASAVADMLHALRIAPDHNTAATPGRVARMLVREVFAGRYQPAPAIADFPNAAKLDQISVVGPIAFRSCCAHHLVPILGEAWIGVLPADKLIGLSKFHRLTQWIMARPQMQEEAAEMLADLLDEEMEPRGIGLLVRARHFCCVWRGVRDGPSLMTTSVLRGVFRESEAAKQEFLTLTAGMGFGK